MTKKNGFNRTASRGRTPLRTAAGYSDDSFALRATGVLSIARSGAGFVSPARGGEDIVVPADRVGAALPGDLVEVRLRPPERGATRPTGSIVRVVERATRDVVCTLHRSGRHWTGVPLVPIGGRTFHVADPKGAADGDRVVLRFLSWDNPAFNPEAEVSGVIGPADEPSLDTVAVERAWGLPGAFPDDVLDEASRVAARLRDPGEREDLRGETVVTIDPASAKDFDDALSLSVDDEGRRVLGVHIADVSHFVRPGSALDGEARRRGTSVYLVDHVLPMLPEQLSNGICSLVPGEDRLAFSAFVTFDAGGTPVARRFAKTVIRSSRRLTYAEALAMIEDQDGTADGVRRLVRSLHALAQQLRRNRFDRFSLDLTAPEMVVSLGPDGRMTGLAPAEHDVAHELVEEAMLAANEAVATELANRKIPYISRFHDLPAEEKLQDLEAALAGLGLRTGPIRDAGALQRLLKAVRGTALDYYVSSLVLRSLKRAEYSADKAGHFGLAKRFYGHFTSPIRRYPDLVMHRQLALALAGDRKRQPGREELRAVAASSSQAELRADQAERDLVEIKKYRFLEDRLRAGVPTECDAVVVKCAPYGAFVDVPSLQIGGLVHVSELSKGFVRFDAARDRLVAPEGEIAPGATVPVVVAAVDFEGRKIDFRPVGRVRPAAAGRGAADHRKYSVECSPAGADSRKTRRGCPASSCGNHGTNQRAHGMRKGASNSTRDRKTPPPKRDPSVRRRRDPRDHSS